MKAYDIVGYVYDADIYCPHCIVRTLVFTTPVAVTTVLLPPDEALAVLAAAREIDHLDESAYDSGDFPKVIFADSVTSSDETCTVCDQPLIEGLGDGWRD